MKRALLLLLLLCAVPSFAGTWTLVQHVSNTACGSASTTCSVSVSALGAGNDLMLYVGAASGDTISSVSGGGSWTIPASGCNTSTNLNAYLIGASAGATTVQVTLSAAPGFTWTINFREYNSTATSTSFDGCAAVASPNCTACVSPSLVLTGTNDVVVASATTPGSFTTVNTPYGDADFPNGNGVADHLNSNSGAGATFNQTLNTAGLVTLAFREGTVQGSATQNVRPGVSP